MATSFWDWCPDVSRYCCCIELYLSMYAFVNVKKYYDDSKARSISQSEHRCLISMSVSSKKLACNRSRKDKNGLIDIFHLMPHLTSIGLRLILVLFYPLFTWLDIFWTFVIWRDRVQQSLHVLFRALLLMMVQNQEWLFLSFVFSLNFCPSTWPTSGDKSHVQKMKPKKVLIHNSPRPDWHASNIDLIYHPFLCCQGGFQDLHCI